MCIIRWFVACKTIRSCRALKTLSSRNEYLPKALTSLFINNCSELKWIVESFDNNKCLRDIYLKFCENLASLPLGLEELTCLESIWMGEYLKLLLREGVPSSLIELYLYGSQGP